MPKVTFLAKNKTIHAKEGETILKVAAKARVFISQRCGGKASCAMCKVMIKNTGESPLFPPEGKEKRLLSDQQLEQGIRLACQAKIKGNVEVAPMENKLQSIIQAQLEKQKRESEL